MKKLLCAFLLFVWMVGAASAERIGTLSRLNGSEAQFQKIVLRNIETGPALLAPGFEDGISVRFYDTMLAMQMALMAGEVDSLELPECVGKYLLKANPQYTLRGVTPLTFWLTTSLGFRSTDKNIQARVNAALSDMKEDGKLASLIWRYITGPDAETPQPVAFEKFDDAETLTVAVTGDLPPLDYIAPDGIPAGFNVAVLAELGRRLHINIAVKNIDAAARAAALASRRVDCIFWFETPYAADPSEPRLDLPESIILSDPYYSWDSVYDIGMKKY